MRKINLPIVFILNILLLSNLFMHTGKASDVGLSKMNIISSNYEQSFSSGNVLEMNKLISSEPDTGLFYHLNLLPWNENFFDSGTDDWTDYWTLDGMKANLLNTPEGMEFHAGPVFMEDSSHSVIWTNKDFEGDMKIEFTYTKLDDQIRSVNIIFIQATGKGEGSYVKDISEWANLRTIPAMNVYFNNMHTYHVSYAAFNNDNNDPQAGYIRARRYNAGPLQGTELPPDYTPDGLFQQGVEHHFTIIKANDHILMRIEAPDQVKYFSWHNIKFPSITEGHIGIRHMATRSGRYADFRVSVMDSSAFSEIKYPVRIKVRDETSHDPLPGAEVVFAGETYSTGEDGIIDMPETKYGVHNLIVNREGFHPIGPLPIWVYSDTTFIVDLKELLPVVNFEVLNKSTLQGINRAFIQMPGRSANTGSTGLVTIENVQRGEFSYTVSSNGFFPFSDTLYIEKDTSLVVRLTPTQANVFFEVAENEQLMSGVSVKLGTWSFLTGANGKVAFYGFPARENYSYSINHAGYLPVEENFFLELDTTIAVNLIPQDVSAVKAPLARKIMVFPNPVSDILFIELTEPVTNTELKVYDLMGRVILQKKFNGIKLELDVQKLEAGSYVLSLSEENYRNYISFLISR